MSGWPGVGTTSGRTFNADTSPAFLLLPRPVFISTTTIQSHPHGHSSGHEGKNIIIIIIIQVSRGKTRINTPREEAASDSWWQQLLHWLLNLTVSLPLSKPLVQQSCCNSCLPPGANLSPPFWILMYVSLPSTEISASSLAVPFLLFSLKLASILN